MVTNRIKEPTCFKKPLNPCSVEVLLTNMSNCFQNSTIIETGLFDTSTFRTQLNERLSGIKEFDIEYDNFEIIFIELLNVHAPMKKRIPRANFCVNIFKKEKR